MIRAKYLVLLFSLCFSLFSYGKGIDSNVSLIQNNALGVRGSAGTYFGGETSYQRFLQDNRRIQIDGGAYGPDLPSLHVSLAVNHQWVWKLTHGLNWFTGPGSTLSVFTSNDDKNFGMGIAGILGLEYNFRYLKVPLLLAIDTRPVWNIIGDQLGLDWQVALSVRILFK